MIIFLVGCSKLTFKSSGVKTYSCTEGWMRTNDYAGQVNSVGDAKNIYLARLKFEDLSRFNLTNITIIERNFTNQKGDIVWKYNPTQVQWLRQRGLIKKTAEFEEF